MKKIIVLFLLFSTPVYADTVMNGLTPVAVNQGGQPFCGEAAASEALWAAGWAMESDPQATFQVLANHFNAAIWPSWGISWYIDTYAPVTPLDMVSIMTIGSATPDQIKYDINKGLAVDASWFAGDTGHALAVWGYDDNGFWLTNSWGSSALFEVPVTGFYATGDLREVVGLLPESEWIPAPPPVPPPLPVVVVGVLEPSTFCLLGFGILCYFSFVVFVGKFIKFGMGE